MDLAVTIPTRGIVFTETIESIFREVPGTPVFLTNNLPLPICHNEVVKKALSINPKYVLMIEEDNVIPQGGVKAMFDLKTDIACIDYPVTGGWSTVCRKNGEILWCGLGCALIKSKVFKKLGFPYFRNDQTLRITNLQTLEYVLEDIPNKYGGHDILFGYYARQAGFKIAQVPDMEAKHLRMEFIQRGQKNDETGQIYALPGISKWQNYPKGIEGMFR